MRVIHTSDWHVGKLLRGESRIEEHRAVLGEIAEIADRERADLILVVGDLYETAAPPPEATAVVYDALLALRETGAHVVVVGGNHDQQSQLESVAPVFARLGITVLGLPAGPDRAVVDVAGARVVMMPWVSQRWAIKTEQLMAASAAATAQYYAARVARLLAWLSEGFTTDTINIVAAHCMVQGGTLGGGERDAQLIDEYAVPTAAFPAAANYVALGHLHRAQQMPGAAPIWYSGSPIQVDFGEERDVKQILSVEIPDRGAAKVTPVALTRGTVLRTLRGTFAELEAAAPTAGDAFLRVFVREQPRAGLADDVRALLPNAVDVRVAPDLAPDVPGAAPSVTRAASPRDLFGQYLAETGHAVDDRLVGLFDELLDAGERLMRPLALELVGFAAFREPTAVDFADADLFAIVGATGHGKSSLIDAISFALYGKVPRHGERDIAPVMTLGCNETRVSFTFELAGASYIATRILRRKPSGEGATTRALRLERLQPDGSTEVIAGSAREFQPAIQKLVGLDFEQFTKCVVLPQGQFASFLHARAGDRVAILSALLDLGRYDRMAANARERAKRSAGAREVLVTERGRLGEATDAALDAARARHDALSRLRTDVDAASPRDAALATEIDAARSGAEAAHCTARALAAVHVPDELRGVVEQIDDARAAAERAAVEADAAEARALTAEAERDGLPALDDLRAAADAHAQRATVSARIEKGATIHVDRAAQAEAAKEALVAARADAVAAQTGLEDAQHRHAHAGLRASLHVGEPCPVCDQPVVKLPPKARTTEIEKARKAAATATKARGEAERTAQTALTALAESGALLDALKEQIAALDARVAAYPDAVELTTTIDAVRAGHDAATKARAAATTARRSALAAAKNLTTFDAALARADAALQQQRDGLVAAGLEPPRSKRGPLAAQWIALASWAEDARPDHEKRAAELADLATAKTIERESIVSDLVQRAVTLGARASDEPTVAALTLAVASTQHEADEALRTLERRLARAVELDAEISERREEELVASELGRLLDKGHFGQWLVDEALRGLVAGASTLLDRLSGGQYALTTTADGELLVIDRVNADETRSVRSLSGGETFQASLALALALADRIADLAADGAATLESIFLDEGFGTLDPETLDVVASTIESLGSGERVVGVVTHVPALAERMPVRFRVRKIGRTSTVTREDA